MAARISPACAAIGLALGLDEERCRLYRILERDIMKTTQISARVTLETKQRLERYVRATGVTRAHLIEQALLHHLQALEDLPADIIVPARVVLTRESAERVRDLISHPPAPTEAMKRLFDDR
jgi:predicted DNA-binding protein